MSGGARKDAHAKARRKAWSVQPQSGVSGCSGAIRYVEFCAAGKPLFAPSRLRVRNLNHRDSEGSARAQRGVMVVISCVSLSVIEMKAQILAPDEGVSSILIRSAAAMPGRLAVSGPSWA